jgi:glutamate racemase
LIAVHRLEKRSPVGVFDSGVGGLTVLRALRAVLPDRDFIYLGDTARLPYGTKSADSVARYSVQCAEALMARGIGCLVVACNTASASAMGALRARYNHIPVIGVIEPGAAAAVAASRSGHVAVIGTEGTIGGGAYQAALRRLNPAVRVAAQACSLFVAMAEEGWVDGPIAEAVARRYLEPMFAGAAVAAGIPDTLVLGCTHFPVLVSTLRAVLPAGVTIVDSAASVATVVAREVAGALAGAVAGAVAGALAGAAAGAVAGAAAGATKGAAAGAVYDPALPLHGTALAPHETALPRELSDDMVKAPGGRVQWLATDGAQRFARVSSVFLGTALRADEIEIIDL